MSDEELKELEKSEEKKGFKWTNLEQVFEVINKQQARIDKAIEYIKNYYFYNNIDFDVKELLDILKGSDKE